MTWSRVVVAVAPRTGAVAAAGRSPNARANWALIDSVAEGSLAGAAFIG